MNTLSQGSENLQELIKEAIQNTLKQIQPKEWMSLKEAAIYAGVSYNTLIKYRVMGLKVAEIDGTRRVSKTEIDRFFKSFSS